MPRTLGQSNEVRLELRRGTAVSVTIGGCQGSGTEPLVFLAEECGDRVSIHRAVRPSRFTLPGERNGSGLSASAIATRAQVLAGTLKSPWDPGGSLKAVGKSPWIERRQSPAAVHDFPIPTRGKPLNRRCYRGPEPL